jgi:hypothetical protein
VRRLHFPRAAEETRRRPCDPELARLFKNSREGNPIFKAGRQSNESRYCPSGELPLVPRNMETGTPDAQLEQLVATVVR